MHAAIATAVDPDDAWFSVAQAAELHRHPVVLLEPYQG